MPSAPIKPASRRPSHVSLSFEHLAEARELGVNARSPGRIARSWGALDVLPTGV
ncbi:MAG TPA: hypothetical protein VL331_12440 [Croceibacterium sp.]|nr:hypothetical protein [Croceibacterium sp.]